MKLNPTVYQRIARAAKEGKGLCLTAEEVWDLYGDDAISQRAEKDDENSDGVPDKDLF